MYSLQKLRKPVQHIFAVLSFLVGIVAACSIYITGYRMLGALITIGMVRAFLQYVVGPRRCENRLVNLIRLPLDAVSLVSALALLLTGGAIGFYARLSADPSTSAVGVLMVIAGAFCAVTMFRNRQLAQEE